MACKTFRRIGDIIHPIPSSHPLHGSKDTYEVSDFTDFIGLDPGALDRCRPNRIDCSPSGAKFLGQYLNQTTKYWEAILLAPYNPRPGSG